MTTWTPQLASQHWTTPRVGALVGAHHAVWRVIAVADESLTDADRDVCLAAGMPDPRTWPLRPYAVELEHVAGAPPTSQIGQTGKITGAVTVRAGQRVRWCVYPDGRWPACSCCGEPMPCRAQLQDREVARHG